MRCLRLILYIDGIKHESCYLIHTSVIQLIGAIDLHAFTFMFTFALFAKKVIFGDS